MKIINKLEKHNLIIESINDDIDSLINENIFTDLISLGVGGVPGIIRKKVIEKLFDDSEKEKKEKEKEKEKLEKELDKEKEEKEKEELEKQIKDLTDQINDLKIRIKGYSEIEDEKLPFNKITINFKNKTSLDIEKLKSPEYKRNLIGTMYFKVVDFDESNKTMLLKTNSFPNTLTLRLTYNKLIDNIDLSGTAQLLYNKYGNLSDNSIEGEEKDIYFKILKMN